MRGRGSRGEARARLVYHVQELERLEQRKADASADMRDAFELAEGEGFDKATLRVVLKLRKMTPTQRQERRALEAIYLAALGMLEGDSLPDTARRRLDGLDEPPAAPRRDERRADATDPRAEDVPHEDASPAPPEQPPLIVKDPAEAREEGAAAATAGKRIYDNPYPAGDPCRAAWDEGWCGQQQTHGMDTPAAFRRRSQKPEKKEPDAQGTASERRDEKGAA